MKITHILVLITLDLKNRMIKSITYLVLISLLSGCVGAGIIHPTTKEHSSFEIASHIDSLIPSSSQTCEGENPSPTEIKSRLGHPDIIIRKSDNLEIWRYKEGLRCVGIVPMIGIGIPLFCPYAKGKSDVHIQNNQAIKLIQTYTTWSGGYYGPKGEDSMEYGFWSLGG